MRSSRQHEDGYALVAAVASIVVFAMMALSILTATRTTIVDADAEIGQARASAAADAGIALALSGLLARDAADRWTIDGRPHVARFGAAALRIRVEDERGKVPINLLDEDTTTRLLEAAGVAGERLKIARGSLIDWIDANDEPDPFGAESGYYLAQGYRARNGALQSIGELRRVRGFDAALIARIAPLVTVNFGRANFEARFASPAAISVMQGGGEGSVGAIERARELDGQRTAFDVARQVELVGRPLTIVVETALPGGARATRRAIVELTGSALRPYVVRSYES